MNKIILIISFFSITTFSFENPFGKMVDSAKEKIESVKNAEITKKNPKANELSEKNIDVSITKSETDSNSVMLNGTRYKRDRDEPTILLFAHPFPHTEAVEVIKDIESKLKFVNEEMSTVEDQISTMKRGLGGNSYYTSQTLTAINLNRSINCLERLRESEMHLESSPLLSTHPRRSELAQKTEKARVRCLANYHKTKPLYLTALERFFVDKKKTGPEYFGGEVSSYFHSESSSQLDKRGDLKVAGIFKKLGCHIPKSDLEDITCN